MIKKINIYKPIYKKFLYLKKNVQNKTIKKFIKLKKKKTKFNFYKLYDIQKYSLRYKSGNKRKRSFKFFLQNKQIFKLYYGAFSKNFTKKVFTKFKNSLKNYFTFFDFIELRLDIILYRSKFASSIRNARQLINHKHLTINKNIMTKYSYILKKGDIVKINKKSQHLVIDNLIKVILKPVPLYYLLINYRTLEICLNNVASLFNIFIYIPFWLNFKMLINNYK